MNRRALGALVRVRHLTSARAERDVADGNARLTRAKEALETAVARLAAEGRADPIPRLDWLPAGREAAAAAGRERDAADAALIPARRALARARVAEEVARVLAGRLETEARRRAARRDAPVIGKSVPPMLSRPP